MLSRLPSPSCPNGTESWERCPIPLVVISFNVSCFVRCCYCVSGKVPTQGSPVTIGSSYPVPTRPLMKRFTGAMKTPVFACVSEIVSCETFRSIPCEQISTQGTPKGINRGESNESSKDLAQGFGRDFVACFRTPNCT